ncbi:unnamed protein product [Prorocentrum cordatum]|uniref:Uncharacterized protein n=1 Tax=Prorocentrum cordatum TaxID=2364126 RepID=A0ABN9XQ25_9DINO|nr:unnamed protein product [Polarella glacialis]
MVDVAAAAGAAVAEAAPAPSVLAVDDGVAEGAGAVALPWPLVDDAWADELPALPGGRMAADAADAGGLVLPARVRAEVAAANAAHDTRRITAIVKEAAGSAWGGRRTHPPCAYGARLQRAPGGAPLRRRPPWFSG